MGNSMKKKNRMFDIFYRAMRGENISVKNIADEYGVSTKSIARDINEIKNFLYDNRELVGNTELRYDSASKSYYLEFDNFLLSKELMAIVKILIGSRALSKMELLDIINKLKKFTSHHDKEMLESLISNEMYHYNEVNCDCNSVIDNLWKLIRCIDEKTEITITYFKMNRELVDRRIRPVAIMFSEYYFYLIAESMEGENVKAKYYRVDRIVNVVEHRNRLINHIGRVDEGELRSKIQYMFPGETRRIKFEFTGPSVQAVLDKIPTAKIIEKRGDVKVIEAETYGTGINMFLLSQGKNVKVLEPKELLEEMKNEVEMMMGLYTK